MRKIIENKVYSTETAKFIAEYWNGLSKSDFNYLCEGLYRSHKGQWFIAGKGGANSNYAESFGNSRSEGSNIRLLTRTEALSWIVYHQKHISDSDEIVEEYFSDLVDEG